MNSCDQAAATRVLIGTAHDEEMQENVKTRNGRRNSNVLKQNPIVLQFSCHYEMQEEIEIQEMLPKFQDFEATSYYFPFLLDSTPKCQKMEITGCNRYARKMHLAKTNAITNARQMDPSKANAGRSGQSLEYRHMGRKCQTADSLSWHSLEIVRKHFSRHTFDGWFQKYSKLCRSPHMSKASW